MAAFATALNVANRLGTTFTAEETIQANDLLEDVAEEIRSRLPLIDTCDTWIVDGKVTAGLARKVSVDIVEAYLNGSGLGVLRRAHPELQDEYTDAAANGLVPTDDQIDRLTPASTKVAAGRPFSIRPMGDY
jgi:hypothetical protein